jgi:hypothetical protein
MDAEWISACAAIIGVFVAIASMVTSRAALAASKNALSASQNMGEMQNAIKIALLDFKDDLAKEKLLVNHEVIDFRFKGEDDKISQLDHRVTRTQEQVSMVLKALLQTGVAMKINASALFSPDSDRGT